MENLTAPQPVAVARNRFIPIIINVLFSVFSLVLDLFLVNEYYYKQKIKFYSRDIIIIRNRITIATSVLRLFLSSSAHQSNSSRVHILVWYGVISRD